MPRLGDSAGGDNSGGGGPPGSRSGATATAYPNLRRNKVATFLYILTMTLILRNMFFNVCTEASLCYLISWKFLKFWFCGRNSLELQERCGGIFTIYWYNQRWTSGSNVIVKEKYAVEEKYSNGIRTVEKGCCTAKSYCGATGVKINTRQRNVVDWNKPKWVVLAMMKNEKRTFHAQQVFGFALDLSPWCMNRL